MNIRTTGKVGGANRAEGFFSQESVDSASKLALLNDFKTSCLGKESIEIGEGSVDLLIECIEQKEDCLSDAVVIVYSNDRIDQDAAESISNAIIANFRCPDFAVCFVKLFSFLWDNEQRIKENFPKLKELKLVGKDGFCVKNLVAF